jgi:two-component system, OmpR family, sensor histidine kinase KdpD
MNKTRTGEKLTPYDLVSSTQGASLKSYIWTLLSIAFITGVGKALDPYFDRIDIALLYLLPVLVSAVRWGRGPSFFASFLGVLTFDFFFVPPFLSFAVSEIRHIFIFVVFLVVSLVTGTMATRLRDEAAKAVEREKRTLALYALGREIAAQTDLEQILRSFVTTVAEAIHGQVVILMPRSEGADLNEIASEPPGLALSDDKERAVAQWVFDQGQNAGKDTDTLRETGRTFFPVSVHDKVLAVLAISMTQVEETVGPRKKMLIEAFANLGAVAIIRVRLAREAEQARWLVESEKLHTALLNSISHDLRTPLAAITGAVTTLLSKENLCDRETEDVLLQTIEEEAHRMNRFVANLLDMVRIEGGMLKLKEEWCDIQDILGVALREIKDIIVGHPLKIDIPADLPLVKVDFPLIEHVMINLLENAAKYSTPGSEISVSARHADKTLQFTVTDRSPPVPAAERMRVFDKFYRLHYSKQVGGTGLGLSICKGIVEAHQGRIWVDPSPDYGNRFTFTLPVTDQPMGDLPHEEGTDYGK